MATLLLHFAGLWQSWGTFGRFDNRPTDREPSKSGVLGVICAALGVPRTEDPLPYRLLSMGVRTDQIGSVTTDYQTSGYGGIAKSSSTKKKIVLGKNCVISNREYLTDSVFLVGIEGDRHILSKIQEALKDPVWPISLGRRNCIPSVPIYLKDGLIDKPLVEALSEYPWLGITRWGQELPKQLRLSIESNHGIYRRDQLVGSFASQKFGLRQIESKWIQNPTTDEETQDVDFFKPGSSQSL